MKKPKIIKFKVGHKTYMMNALDITYLVSTFDPNDGQFKIDISFQTRVLELGWMSKKEADEVMSVLENVI